MPSPSDMNNSSMEMPEAKLRKMSALGAATLEKSSDDPAKETVPMILETKADIVNSENNYYLRQLGPKDNSLVMIYQNSESLFLKKASDIGPFQTLYIHPKPVRDGDFFEVRIEDMGNMVKADWSKLTVGIGLLNMSSALSNNRTEFGFDVGIAWCDQMAEIIGPEGRETYDCPDSNLIPWDVIKCNIESGGPVFFKYDKIISMVTQPKQSLLQQSLLQQNEYQIVIGLQNPFSKVTMSYNQSFDKVPEELKIFPKQDLRVFVASMNEGSPDYAAGVAEGGKQLLKNGMLIRKLNKGGMRISNFQPGCKTYVSDSILGDVVDLSKFLPPGLLRNRVRTLGSLLTMSRNIDNEYEVLFKSELTGDESKFVGTDEKWAKERAYFLNNGHKYLIALAAKPGEIQDNVLMVAGVKCKTIHEMVYSTLIMKDQDKGRTPAVLLLGGDRIMSVASVAATYRAYEDVCVIWIDAHVDLRDPQASDYALPHGAPLFFLLQNQLRKAAKEWDECLDKDTNDCSDLTPEAKLRRSEIKHAINFLKCSNGSEYWDRLKGSPVSYPGFQWLQCSKIADFNPRRLASVGLRKVKNEGGSLTGSPHTNFFNSLLNINDCIYTSKRISSEGVPKVFSKIINQFRSTFDADELQKRDAQESNGNWIPPIMVSWDVDAIDPNDMPCTIAQDPDGLSAEDCLSLADAVAETQRLVSMDVVEFNPELWGGYKDENITLTVRDLEAGPFCRAPRAANDKSKQQLDKHASTTLLQNIIKRIWRKESISN